MTDLINLVPGQKVRFKGYSDEVSDPLLTPGEIVQIRAINPDGGLIIDMLDKDGNVRADVEETDTLFPEEIEAITVEDIAPDAPVEEAAEEVAEEAEPAAAEAPAKADKSAAKGKGKGKSQTSKAAQNRAAAMAQTPSPVEMEEEAGPRSSLVRSAILSVGEGVAEEEAALFAAKRLVNQVDETYYTLGGVLAYIKETGCYKALGYDGKRGFADYCKAELGTDYRKAAYLIDVYEKVQAAGLNEKRLAEIGWSKAIQIVRVGDVSLEQLSNDFDALVDFAKENSRDDLISHIHQTYEVARRAGNTQEKVTTSTFLFKLQSEAAASAERALQHAKSLADTDDLSAAFQYICDDWSLMTEGTSIDLQTAIQTIEARFGVRLVVADGEDGAVAEDQNEEAQAEA